MKFHVVDEGCSDFDMDKDGKEGDIIHYRTCNQEGTQYYRIVIREGKRELVEEQDFEHFHYENAQICDDKNGKKKKTKHIKPKKILAKIKRDKISR